MIDAWLEEKMFDEGNRNREDLWFAWRPVFSGALGTGSVIFLELCWRNKCCGATIYQPLSVLDPAKITRMRAEGKK